MLINNAGIAASGGIKAFREGYDTLSSLRQHYTDVLSTNVASVAVVTTAFLPLLHLSKSPKVINISSGLASMARQSDPRATNRTAGAYGSSKVGLNGVTVHMQGEENDRAKKEGIVGIKYYAVAPGFLKTAFTGFREGAKDPKEGAEVVTRIVLDEEEKYPGGKYWQFRDGEMVEVAW